jgi:hypothetical protein
MVVGTEQRAVLQILGGRAQDRIRRSLALPTDNAIVDP